MIGEGDDLADVNHVLGLINREPIRRLHFWALACYQAGNQNRGIEDALKEHFESTSVQAMAAPTGDSDDRFAELIQYPGEERTPNPAVISPVGPGLKLKML